MPVVLNFVGLQHFLEVPTLGLIVWRQGWIQVLVEKAYERSFEIEQHAIYVQKQAHGLPGPLCITALAFLPWLSCLDHAFRASTPLFRAAILRRTAPS